jgi:hydroxymethylglutaryl-CoA lyase
MDRTDRPSLLSNLLPTPLPGAPAGASNWTPSIVPRDDDQNVYLVLDDLGRYGCAWREADPSERINLADTVGYANPAQIKRLFSRVRKEIGAKLEAAHLHNTRGLGLANALAAYEEGVRHFDSSLGGLGGCPFAPGASGNVITEDLVFMFEAMGVRTGIDLDKLMAARKLMVDAIPQEPTYGHFALAGVPKGFRGGGIDTSA